MAGQNPSSSTSSSVQSAVTSTYQQIHFQTIKTIENHPRLSSKIAHSITFICLLTFMIVWTIICRIKGILSKFIPDSVKQQIRPFLGLPSTTESTLISIRFSHYVEKGRWALDLLTDQIKLSALLNKIVHQLEHNNQSFAVNKLCSRNCETLSGLHKMK